MRQQKRKLLLAALAVALAALIGGGIQHGQAQIAAPAPAVADPGGTGGTNGG